MSAVVQLHGLPAIAPPTSAALTTYETARQAIATCVVIDDAKEIKDRAEALRQYALQRNDPERADWLGQIACRAAIRIGEISKVLEKVETVGRSTVRLPINGKPKAETLADAGISTSAAGRYEAMAKKADILDEYFEACATSGRAPSVGSLAKFMKGGPAESEFSSIIKPTDNWNFNPVRYGRIDGEDGHGYIPGDIYANCLWYYTKPGDIVAAPMAGSGQIMRVYEARHEWAIPEPWELDIRMFDLNPRGRYAGEITHNDLTKGLPVDQPDYIVMDVPYFGMVEGQYSNKTEDLANMALDDWASAMDKIAAVCAQAQVEGTLCTTVCPNYADVKAKRRVMASKLVEKAFERAGYELFDTAFAARHIQQSQQPGMGQLNNLAKRNRTPLTDMAVVATFVRVA